MPFALDMRRSCIFALLFRDAKTIMPHQKALRLTGSEISRTENNKRMHRLPNAGFLVYKGITRNILCEIYRGALAYPQGAVRAKGPTKSATEER